MLSITGNNVDYTGVTLHTRINVDYTETDKIGICLAVLGSRISSE